VRCRKELTEFQRWSNPRRLASQIDLGCSPWLGARRRWRRGSATGSRVGERNGDSSYLRDIFYRDLHGEIPLGRGAIRDRCSVDSPINLLDKGNCD
jgi:hypothetical protein